MTSDYSRDARNTIKIFNEEFSLVDRPRVRPFDDLLEPPSLYAVSRGYRSDRHEKIR